VSSFHRAADHPVNLENPGESGKVTSVREESGKLWFACDVMCYRSCDGHKINITRILLSKALPTVFTQKCT